MTAVLERDVLRFRGNFTRGEADACWLWRGPTSPTTGYGVMAWGRTSTSAHRFAYEQMGVPVSEGCHVDHLCHNADPDCPGGPTCLHRACVNPAHLEAVTPAENNRRAPRQPVNRTHCVRGHPFAGDNLRIGSRGQRQCLTCNHLFAAAYRARCKAARILRRADDHLMAALLGEDVIARVAREHRASHEDTP